jgi:hypothetical protein
VEVIAASLVTLGVRKDAFVTLGPQADEQETA